MAAEFYQPISELIAVLLAGGALHYAKIQAMPALKQRNFCRNLIGLQNSLRAVSETGERIGELLEERTFQEQNKQQLGQLIEVLETQQENLRKAHKHYNYVARAIEYKAPELQSMHIHLRGKADRIEIIYSIARRAELGPWLQQGLKPWERSKLLTNPRELIVALSNSDNHELAVDNTDYSDKDYQKLVELIEPLGECIGRLCNAEFID
jgi:hypothetical protein